MSKLLKLLIILYLFSPLNLYSIERNNIRFNKLSSYEQSSPSAVTKDKFGFLWIATSDGLFKFDGYKYIKYQNDSNESNTISSGSIRSLLLDSKGQLWVATTNGINKYDYINDNFHHYELETKAQQFVYEIFETSDQRIWIATEDGVLKLDSKLNEFKSFRYFKNSDGIDIPIAEARTFYQDSYDTLWIGTINNGVLEYIFSDEIFEQRTKNSYPKLIVGITEYTEQYLLVGSYETGLHLINKRSGADKIDADVLLSFPKIRVKDLIKDSNGMTWIATQSNGLFTLKNNKFNHLRQDDIDPMSIPDSQINNIYEDSDNKIWISTLNSITIHTPRNSDSMMSYFISNEYNGLSSKNVYAITEDQVGNIYFGSRRTGIDVLSKETGIISNIEIKNGDKVISPSANALLFVKDTLWVGTSNGLVYSNDLNIFHSIKQFSNKQIMSIKSISKNLLIVVTTNSIFVVNSGTLAINEISERSGIEAFNIDKSIYDDSFWITVMDYGLFQISNKGKLLHTILMEEFNNSKILSSYNISENFIWIGFYDSGMKLYDLKNKKIIKTIDESSGLPSNRIYTINNDTQGNLWVSTQRGISKIYATSLNSDSDKIKIDNFNELDGLQSIEYNFGSFYKDHFGIFYYGGTTGVTSFNPSRFNKYPKQPSVLWTKRTQEVEDVLINYYTLGNKKQPLFKADELELRYNDKVHIEFSTTELLSSKNVLYRTRLIGGSEDGKWKIGDYDYRRRDFSLLPSGSYKFEVEASLNNGYEWSEPLILNINKESPPWNRWWAYFIYLILIILIFSFFARKQLAKSIEKQKVQKLIADSEERLKLALWGSRDELWDWNLISGKIHRSNTWGIIDFPKRETDTDGNNAIFRNVHPKDLPVVRAALEDHKNGYTSHYEATYRVKDVNGKWIWILDRGKVVEHDVDGRSLRMSGTIRNITDIKDTQEQYDLIAKAFENTSDGVFILDNNFNYQAANKAYEKITGFSAEDRIDRQFSISSANTLQKEILQQIRQSLILDGSWQGELDDTRSSGELYTIELKFDAVKDRLDETTHYVGVFSDITFRKKAEEDLRRMANYDQLTGLPNRSLFQERLKHAIALSERLNKQLILLFIDLDNFKVVNDSLGHSIGDKLLSKAAERISACVRGNDTVARLGGDEYTILLEQVENELVGTKVADKILEALSRPFRIQGHELVIGCSIGIATYPDDGTDVESLLRNADTAMYSAKYKDKNNYQFFTESMNKKANRRLEMEHELRKAIQSREIEVFYQPKVSISTGEIIGCEALARWHHPEFGHVSPVDFIPLAEETGLIYSLGEHVLSISCYAAQRWIEKFKFKGRIAVNLSAMQFRQTDLLDIVKNVLAKTKLNGSSLELEITEGMLVQNQEQTIETMNSLCDMNIHLSIDDFGTGYASLAQLKKFPINILKIDKSFIDDITLSDRDANLVKAILSLSSNLQIATVAEGVETFEQLDLLGSMGCDVIQGYVYSKAISAEDYATLLSKNITLDDIRNETSNKILKFPA